jgi:hypothetical protein
MQKPNVACTRADNNRAQDEELANSGGAGWMMELGRALGEQFHSFPGWDKQPVEQARRRIHLAVFTEPYLGYILAGQKTIESRFSITRKAPYEQVSPGDLILLKKTGGPICGFCRVTNVWFYQLTPKSFVEIQRQFSKQICAQDPQFWESRREAQFATLMRIDDVAEIPPIAVSKKDRRGWVVLNPPNSNEYLFS